MIRILSTFQKKIAIEMVSFLENFLGKLGIFFVERSRIKTLKIFLD